MATFYKDIIVLDKDGNSLGTMSFNRARDLANQENLDLVKISEQERQIVYKIMDEGKWMFEQKKKDRDKNKNNKIPSLKEIKFHLNTDDHDVQTKVGHIRRFLNAGHPVKVSVELQGRFKNYLKSATEKLESIISSVNIEIRRDSVKTTNNSSSMTIHPIGKTHERQKNNPCQQGREGTS